MHEHRSAAVPGFASRYGVLRLVHYEIFEDYPNVAQREKRLKKWLRAWKIALIEAANPQWRDLYDEIAV